MKRKKIYTVIIILILVIIISLTTFFMLISSNPKVTYLKNANETLTKTTNALVEMKDNTTLNSNNILIYNQGQCYEYGQEFENEWNTYDQNTKVSSTTKNYYNEVESIKIQEKQAYNLITDGVTLYLNGSEQDKTLGISYIKEAYSIINILNTKTVPNTINSFKQEITLSKS